MERGKSDFRVSSFLEPFSFSPRRVSRFKRGSAALCAACVHIQHERTISTVSKLNSVQDAFCSNSTRTVLFYSQLGLFFFSD